MLKELYDQLMRVPAKRLGKIFFSEEESNEMIERHIDAQIEDALLEKEEEAEPDWDLERKRIKEDAMCKLIDEHDDRKIPLNLAKHYADYDDYLDDKLEYQKPEYHEDFEREREVEDEE